MSREHVQKVIDDYIDTSTPEVLAITGPWGVGKTYAIRTLIARYKGEHSLKRYAYVSVFGAQSLASVRTDIVTALRRLPIKEEVYESRREKAARVLPVRELMGQLRDVNAFGTKNVVVAVEALAGAFVRDTLICIDDIERMSDKIAMQDLMGFVSELRDQRDCKVILVLNEDQLERKREAFNRYSEKVIDQKLTFSLSPSEAVELGLSPDTPCRDQAADHIARLEISNIRVIKKIERALRLIFPIVKTSSERLQTQIVIGACVFAAALYEGGRGFPPAEEIVKYNVFTRTMTRVQGGQRQADPDPFWVGLLERCQFSHADELDQAVLKVMQSGHLAGSDIEERVSEADAVARRDELNAKFTAAWELFRERLDVAAPELVRAITDAVNEAASVISPVNMNSTVKLMRDLGFNDEADAAIESYIRQRRDTPYAFDIDSDSRMGEVDDPKFRLRCLVPLC